MLDSFVICVEVKFGVGLRERFGTGARYFFERFGLAERLVKVEGERERDRFRVFVGGPRYSLLGMLVVLFCVATRGGDLETEERSVKC